MKTFYLTFFITALFMCINTSYSQTGTFDFETASPPSGNNIVQTISSSPSRTITVSGVDGGGAATLALGDGGGFWGTSGNVVYANTNLLSFTLSFDNSVNVTTIRAFNTISATKTLKFTPSTGSAVNASVDGTSGTTVTLNFVGITSIVITNLSGGNDWDPGVDNVVIDAALPVELTSFTAAVNESIVNLKWQTATEVNNYGFQVERKKEKVKSGWEKIGFVAGHGNSNSPHDYSFIDYNPVGGTTFSYRLKQIDIDGHYKYYDAITVSLSSSTKAKLMQNSPNPFNPSTAIKFFIPDNSDVTIKIYDMLGREVTTLINQQSTAGYHIVYWNGRDSYGRDAASGVYLYRLTAGSFTETKKMNLLK